MTHEVIILELAEDPSNTVGIAHDYDKLCEILAIGLTAAVKHNESQLVLSYTEKLWRGLHIRNDPDDSESISKTLRMALSFK